MINRELRRQIEAGYRAELAAAAAAGRKASRSAVVEQFRAHVSRASIYRICAGLEHDAGGLPAEPPGTVEDLIRIARTVLGDSIPAKQHTETEKRVTSRLRHITETVLAMAWADSRDSASAVDARNGLRDVERASKRLQRAVDAVPEPVKSHLLGRLRMSGAWNPSGFSRDVADVAAWVEAEALDGAGGTAHGPGTIRKRMFGDAIDYLGGEVLALIRTERPGAELTAGGLFADVLAALWAAATGRGGNDIPELADRAARQLRAESMQRAVAVHVDEEHRLAAAGLPTNDAKAAGDQQYAEAQRARRGRKPANSQNSSRIS